MNRVLDTAQLLHSNRSSPLPFFSWLDELLQRPTLTHDRPGYFRLDRFRGWTHRSDTNTRCSSVSLAAYCICLGNSFVLEWSMINTVPQALRVPRCRSKARSRIEALHGDINFLWNRHPEAANSVPRSLQRRIRENEE